MMNNEIKNKLILFTENTQIVNKGFIWSNDIRKKFTAILYTQKNQSVDIDAIKRCYPLIKKNTNMFSIFRSDDLYFSTMLSFSYNPERILTDTLKVYDMLKSMKFYSSNYLVIAAYQIAVNTDSKDYQYVVERTRAFYDDMKAHHWYYTNESDYIFAAMLGLSDLDIQTASYRIGRLYNNLKKEFSDKNSVQSLSQILVLGSESDVIMYRMLNLRDKLKSQKIQLDNSYTQLSLGVLTLFPVDIDIIVQDLIEARNFLSTQKGFDSFSIRTQELLLYTITIISSVYANGTNNEIFSAALSTSTKNILVAQQTAAAVAINLYRMNRILKNIKIIKCKIQYKKYMLQLQHIFFVNCGIITLQ